MRFRFLPVSSVSSAEIDTLPAGDSAVAAVPGGSVFSLGLCEARRLRGFGGELGGCRKSELGLGANGVWANVAVAVAASRLAILLRGDVVVEEPGFERFCGVGLLAEQDSVRLRGEETRWGNIRQERVTEPESQPR